MTKRFAILLLLAAMTLSAFGQGQRATNPLNDPNAPRPIAARDTVWLEELTWMEVRDAVRAGKTTIIVATGGIESNGPYLALGKHNYILKVMAESIARKLGNALVAPIIPLVPEGNIEALRSPGTISMSEETYEAMLRDVCSSLKQSGFTDIVLIGDSGGNQRGMSAAAKTLNEKWNGQPSRVHFIAEYYGYYDAPWDPMMRSLGVNEVQEGLHDDFGTTAVMMMVDPNTVRIQERKTAKKTTINGVSIVPEQKTLEIAKKIVELRANYTVEAIRKAVGK